MNNPKFKVVKYWANSADVFPTVDIKGGVAVTYHDKKANFGCIGFFSAYEELRTILSLGRGNSVHRTEYQTNGVKDERNMLHFPYYAQFIITTGFLVFPQAHS